MQGESQVYFRTSTTYCYCLPLTAPMRILVNMYALKYNIKVAIFASRIKDR